MIVLDTQAWLWWVHDPGRLSAPARRAVREAERGDGMLVSTISVWEIAVKVALGKLVLPLAVEAWVERATAYPNLQLEPLSAGDAIASTLLPGEFHRDPADRIIIALARRYGVPLITADRLIRSYPHVQCVW